MRKIGKLAAALLFLAALLGINLAVTEKIWSDRNLSTSAAVRAEEKEEGASKKTVVLDAGHGGRDPGKVGEGGVLEKDLNLAIAKETGKILKKKGIRVVYTRTADEALAGEETGEGVSQKLADLQARVERINEEQPALAVSIHQNSYPDPQVSGFQVFYYEESREGRALAQKMEDTFREKRPGQIRVRESKGDSGYYLLKNTKAPALIVECGFLSCPEELERLTDKDWQKMIAGAVAAGILACVGK